MVLTGAATEHLAVAGRILHGLEAELGGTVDLGVLRAELGLLLRALAGEGGLPPLRPVW